MENFFSGKEYSRDILTNIYTRDVISDFVNYLISKNIPFSIILLDIDNFKYINDNYGHAVGDVVIKETAKRIDQVASKIGAAGRFGGDEFMIVLPNVVDYDAVWSACRNIAANLNGTEISGTDGLFVTVTMGLSRFPENESTYDKLLETADKALYRGKMKGRNCFIIYLPEKHANIVLKTEKDKQVSSMYLHTLVFRYLTGTSDIADGIKNLFDYFNSYFMFDNICIQHGKKILYKKTHNLSKNKDFEPIDANLVLTNMIGFNEFFYINQKEHLLKSNQTEFYEALKAQQISSTFWCKISAKDDENSFIRVDSTHIRIWQYNDMDILITTAKLIGVLLEERKISLDELKF